MFAAVFLLGMYVLVIETWALCISFTMNDTLFSHFLYN